MMMRGADVDHLSYIQARTDEDNPDIVNVEIGLYENFLWDASDDDEKEERNELLNRHENIVNEVFHDYFNASVVDVQDGNWESALIEVKVPVLRSRFTPSLVVEDIWSPLAKYRNETDPGTFGSPYVMSDLWARIEKAEQQD